jgi:hypothetical protein
MGDDRRLLSPGDRWRPTAGTINGYQEAADYVRQLSRSGGALPGSGAAAQPCIVPIKNCSGGDRRRFDILGIDTPIFTPADNLDVFQNRPGLVGVVPQSENHLHRFAVLLRPVAENDTAPGCIVGMVPIRLDVTSESHEFAHIADDACDHMVSDSTGCPILWKDDEAHEDENGLRWGLVNLVSAAPSTAVAWYQLLTDMDSDSSYVAWANPGQFDPETGFLSDPHALDEDPIDPAWSVLLLDGSGQMPCWVGDWVKAEPLAFTIAGFEDYSVMMIASKASSQLNFWGQLGSSPLGAGGATAATLVISSSCSLGRIWRVAARRSSRPRCRPS